MKCNRSDVKMLNSATISKATVIVLLAVYASLVHCEDKPSDQVNDGSNNKISSSSGLDVQESHMSSSFSGMGSMMSQALNQKKQMIMNKAQMGMKTGEQLRNMVEGSMQGIMNRGMSGMSGLGGMMGSAQSSMMKGGQEIKKQLQQSLQGHMGRLQGIQSMGGGMMNSVQRIGQTLGQGVTRTFGELQRTGQQVQGEIQNSLLQTSSKVSGLVGSMQGSMGNVGKNMQKNLHSIVGDMQGAVSKVTDQLKKVASGPLEMVQSLAQMGMKGSSGGGRY